MEHVSQCTICHDYEAKTMAKEPAVPCDDYEMSEAFRHWVVESMRGEVMQQVSGSGLDRMAILKADDSEE